MTLTEDERLDRTDAALPDAHNDVAIDLVAHWDETRRVVVRQGGRAAFACLVTPWQGQSWIITDCVPQRRDPELGSVLLAVCDRLATEWGMTQIITISPASWEQRLEAGGADLLQRIVPMWLLLDEDLLRLHGRTLPGGYRIAPMEASVDEPVALGQLSADADRDGDLRVWREVLSGCYGPVIPEASLTIVHGSSLCAAIGVTERHGAPLVSHFVTAAAERGTGLGRALLVESLKRLSESGYVDCHLNVIEDNVIARRLYRSIGFIQARPTLRVTYHSGFGNA